MTFLRWLMGFILLLCLIGLVYSIGNTLLNIMLIATTVIFLSDTLVLRKKKL